MANTECPNCGATFRAGRLACPECGSDAGTGWKSAEEIDYQSVDIPDTWEDPDHPATSDRQRRAPFWVGTVILLTLVAFALSFVLRLW